MNLNHNFVVSFYLHIALWCSPFLLLSHISGQHISALHPRVRSEIDRLVAPDLQVYNHAATLFEQQVSYLLSS